MIQFQLKYIFTKLKQTSFLICPPFIEYGTVQYGLVWYLLAGRIPEFHKPPPWSRATGTPEHMDLDTHVLLKYYLIFQLSLVLTKCCPHG